MEHYICETLDELAQKVDAVYVEDRKAQTLRFESVGNAELSSFVPFIKQHAYKKDIKKLSVKVSEAQAIYFFQHGFEIEASIMAYYGLQDAIFLVYFLDDDTSQINKRQNEIIDKALALQTKAINLTCPEKIEITPDANIDSPQLNTDQAISFSGRFKTSENDDVMVFNASQNNEVIASATAQYNPEDSAVEFAAFMVNLGEDIHTVISALINYMQMHYRAKGCETAFTIVNANSLTINSICAENQFDFGGTLKNESFIDGKLTHLNTWFKRL